MSYRLDKFRSFATSAWWAKRVKTLRPADLEFCESWIVKNDHLSRGDFDMAVMRMWLDKPEMRDRFGKRWKQMDELIANCNVGAP